MAFDPNEPAAGSSPNSKKIRDNFNYLNDKCEEFESWRGDCTSSDLDFLQSISVDADVINNYLSNYEAGDYTESLFYGSTSISSGSYVKVFEWQVNRSGTVRVACMASGSDSSATVYFKLYKNSVPSGTEKTAVGATPQKLYDDISVTSGDLIQLYSKISSGDTGTIDKIALCCKNPHIIGILYDYIEDMS